MTAKQQQTAMKVLSVFETGKVGGDYGQVTVLKDRNYLGENIKQVTFGKYQTTEESNLEDLLNRYVKAQGVHAQDIAVYLKSINMVAKDQTSTIWAKNDYLIEVLEMTGSDPIMIQCQDVFFQEVYFAPALEFAAINGFKLPFSFLVFIDSYIHSGGVKDFLRKRFPERVPKKGGNEKKWIRQYVGARHDWLRNHENEIIARTSYRTREFLEEIERGNWDLLLPMVVQGKKIE